MAPLRALGRALAASLLSWTVLASEGAGAVHRRVLDPTLGFKLHIFAPAGNSSMPVIFFVSGFAGDTPIFSYSDLLTEFADRGFVVVGLDRLGVPNYPRQALDLVKVMHWARGGRLMAKMRDLGLQAVPDVERRSLVMAHSEGNHVVGQALVDDCSGAQAWVMIDPVDGWDPYRFVKSEDLIKPGHKLNFTIPALILDNGLDPRSSNPLFPPCDPYHMGTSRFFPAMCGPVWNVNATAYGHLDCLNKAFDVDWFCASDPASDKAAYHRFLADTGALFFSSLLDRRPTDLRRLEDPESFDLAVTVRQDLQGLALEDIHLGCTHGDSLAGSARDGQSILV